MTHRRKFATHRRKTATHWRITATQWRIKATQWRRNATHRQKIATPRRRTATQRPRVATQYRFCRTHRGREESPRARRSTPALPLPDGVAWIVSRGRRRGAEGHPFVVCGVSDGGATRRGTAKGGGPPACFQPGHSPVGRNRVHGRFPASSTGPETTGLEEIGGSAGAASERTKIFAA